MSKYTTELRYICEKYASKDVSVDYNNIDNVIELSRPYIFDFDYPIFRENYKPSLERKIIKHFYTREICAETVGLWKLFLNRKMCEIMPYYNQRYLSELIEFNPLHNTDFSVSRDNTFTGNKTDDNNRKVTNSGSDVDTTIFDRDIEEDGKNVKNIDTERNIKLERRGTDSALNWHYEADTPQSTIAGINDSNYATSATKDTATTTYNSDDKTDDDTTSSETETSKKTTAEDSTTKSTLQFGKITDEQEDLLQKILNTETFTERRTGKSEGESFSEMLNKFRTTFLNIDMEVIEELNPLFFNLW